MPEYFELPEMPGKPMFRCDRMLASLQVASCATNWRNANADKGEPPERLFKCRQCPLGAQHAGETNASMSPLRGTSTCARCHRRDLRLIGGRICVGCYNREREVLKGKNAKGRFPSQHALLEPRRIRFKAGGRIVSLRRVNTISVDELVIEALRDSRERVTFAMTAHLPKGIRQLRTGA